MAISAAAPPRGAGSRPALWSRGGGHRRWRHGFVFLADDAARSAFVDEVCAAVTPRSPCGCAAGVACAGAVAGDSDRGAAGAAHGSSSVGDRHRRWDDEVGVARLERTCRYMKKQHTDAERRTFYAFPVVCA